MSELDWIGLAFWVVLLGFWFLTFPPYGQVRSGRSCHVMSRYPLAFRCGSFCTGGAEMNRSRPLLYQYFIDIARSAPQSLASADLYV